MTQHSRVAPHRRSRRTVAVLATLTVGALALAACGPAGDSGASDLDFTGKDVGAMTDFGVDTTFVATEPIEFSLFYRDHPNYPIKEDWLFLTHLAEENNVSFDIVSAPLSDWDQRKSTVIGAGTDVPQIISVTHPGQEVQFVSGGAILPVSDYLDYLPNFSDKVKRWGLEAEIDQLRQEDGKFYLLPGIREQLRPQYTYAVRADIWNELGLSLEPESFDEFADQLRQVHEAYPDAWPLSDRWSANGPLEATLGFAAPNFGTAAGWGYGEGVWWDEDAEEFVYTGATDGYRDLVTYYAGLVEDGLLDPESLTQDDDQAIAKFGSGQSFAIATNDQEILKLRSTFAELGQDDAEVALIPVPAGPAGDLLPSGGRLVNGFMLSSQVAESENFLALLQFVDWLFYSDEGLEYAKWGVEGETFTREADGTRVLADDIDINGLNPGAPKALNVDFGFHNGVWMLEHGSTIDLDLSMLRPEVQEFVTTTVDKKEQIALPPPRPLSELEREQVSLWQAALRDHVWQNTARFIVGQRPLSEWDAYIGELDGLNKQQYLDVVNGAVERAAG